MAYSTPRRVYRNVAVRDGAEVLGHGGYYAAAAAINEADVTIVQVDLQQ